MQAADLGNTHDGTERRRLDAPRCRSIPLQGKMRPGHVVVADVFAEDGKLLPEGGIFQSQLRAVPEEGAEEQEDDSENGHRGFPGRRLSTA